MKIFLFFEFRQENEVNVCRLDSADTVAVRPVTQVCVASEVDSEYTTRCHNLIDSHRCTANTCDKNLTGHCRLVRQQSRVRVGDTRPRPGIAVVADHGQSVAAVGARAVRRVADEPVQHWRVGGRARSVGEQDDCRVSDFDTRAGGLDTRTDRDQLQAARPLAPFGAAIGPSESVGFSTT